MQSTTRLRRESPVPLYYQVATYVQQKIASREWPPGHELPSEGEFCRTFGVSRTVVRQAISSLVANDLITKHDGKRSTVAHPKFEVGLMQSLCGFHEDAVASGQKPAAKVLGLGVQPATREVALALNLREGDAAIVLRRLRYLDGEPEGVEVTWLPESLCPALVHEDFSSHSLYELLEHTCCLVLASGYRTIEAVSAGQDCAELLGIQPGRPVLLLKGIGYLADGRPFEYFEARHRGDRSKFRVRVVRTPPAVPKEISP